LAAGGPYPGTLQPAVFQRQGQLQMTVVALKRKAYHWHTMVPFILFHVSALALVFTVPFTLTATLWFFGSYLLRMFGVTGGYHRYFSHRAFKVNRFWQFCLAFLAQTSGQKGVLWWHLAPTVVYGAAIFLIGGWSAFVWGFLVSTVVLYHGTFLINSLAHIWGTKRFPTRDESRNNFWLALVTLGEGWHNNHHHYMSSVRQGIRWWEIDITFYVLKALSWVGITRDLRAYPDTKAREEAA